MFLKKVLAKLAKILLCTNSKRTHMHWQTYFFHTILTEYVSSRPISGNSWPLKGGIHRIGMKIPHLGSEKIKSEAISSTRGGPLILNSTNEQQDPIVKRTVIRFPPFLNKHKHQTGGAQMNGVYPAPPLNPLGFMEDDQGTLAAIF